MNKRSCCCVLFVCLLLIFSTVAVAIPPDNVDAADTDCSSTVPPPGDEPTPSGCTVTGAETCNNLDDDCDGQVDEGTLSSSATCGVGACQRTIASGCIDGQVQECIPAAPQTENCINDVDDDCDTKVDIDDTDCQVCKDALAQISGLQTERNQFESQRFTIERELRNEENSCYDIFIVTRDRSVLQTCLADARTPRRPQMVTLSQQRDQKSAAIAAIKTQHSVACGIV